MILLDLFKVKKTLNCAFLIHRLLNTAQGSLLDDEQLVNTLHSSKTTSTEVSIQLQDSEQTEIKIDAAREVKSIKFVGLLSGCRSFYGKASFGNVIIRT